MEILRKKYLDKLIAHCGNKRVKIVTGIRRCGKSYLLFVLFKNYLIEQGVTPSHIIEIQLDDRVNQRLRNPDKCLAYIRKKVLTPSGSPKEGQYYLLIDEVQMMQEFEDVLNSCLHINNLDTYVTGSNSKFLTKDVITEFRGRGDEIHLNPLSFGEFWTVKQDLTFDRAWDEYITYGGLPYCVLMDDYGEKEQYLKDLFREVYLKDILEHNRIQNDVAMEKLLDIVSSGIGGLTNLRKLEHTFKSDGGITLSANAIGRYLEMLEDAYLLQRVERYDVKGRKYIGTQQKYYFVDMGLRNARLNFRQVEETHLMENAIYNELRNCGYSVDIGVVEVNTRQPDGTYCKIQTEVDFVCNRGSERIYIQSAFSLSTPEKVEQENRSLRKIDDSFYKIIVVKDDILLRRNEQGVITIGIKDFLIHPDVLTTWLAKS